MAEAKVGVFVASLRQSTTCVLQAKEVEEEEAKTGPTPEQLTAIKAAIANASTLEVC